MHARYYAPRLGRFFSVDPANSAAPDRPQTWNRYAYAINNPIKLVDPDGESAISFGIRLLFKGGDVGLTAAGIVADFKSLTGSDSSLGDRLIAGGSLLSEALPISGRDAVAIGGTISGVAAAVFRRSEVAGGTTRGLARRFSTSSERTSVLERAITSEGGINTSQTVARQLARGGVREHIPTQSILETIGSGTRVADPQGVGGQFMFRSPASFNGSQGVLEVLVHEPSGQIRHVLFRSGEP